MVRQHYNAVGMSTKQISARQSRIKKIKKELEELGEIMPGSLSKQYNICGNPTCRCKDRENPRKHGPYYNLSYTWNGKGKTKFVRKEELVHTKERVKNYKILKRLVKQWVDLSLEIVELRKKS